MGARHLVSRTTSCLQCFSSGLNRFGELIKALTAEVVEPHARSETAELRRLQTLQFVGTLEVAQLTPEAREDAWGCLIKDARRQGRVLLAKLGPRVDVVSNVDAFPYNVREMVKVADSSYPQACPKASFPEDAVGMPGDRVTGMAQYGGVDMKGVE